MPPPLIVHVFPTFAVGGAQARFCAIANHAGRAYRHVVLALDGVVACRERLATTLDVTFPTFPLRKGTAFGNLPGIRAWLRETAPDTLVTSNFGAIEFAMATAFRGSGRSMRHVHMEDGFGPEERDRQLPRRVWTRRLSLRSSALILPSHVLMTLARDVWRLPSRALHYVPNGVDLSRFIPPSGRSPAASGLVVGTVAALRAEKNLLRLLRAAVHVPGARVVIVGDGPERSALEHAARTLGLSDRVRFAGHTADPAAEYAGFDVFALSSDTEQMPLSVLEAMAAGLPVTSTDVGDVTRMVASENAAFVTPLGQDDAFAGSLTRLLGDATLRRALGDANRARAETLFDQGLMIRRHMALWDGHAPP